MVGGRRADNDLEAWPASATKPTQHDRWKTSFKKRQKDNKKNIKKIQKNIIHDKKRQQKETSFNQANST